MQVEAFAENLNLPLCWSNSFAERILLCEISIIVKCLLLGLQSTICHPVLVHIFCCFFVSEKLFGEVSQNDLQIYVNYFHEETKTEPGGDLQGAHSPQEQPTPWTHRGPTWVTPSSPKTSPYLMEGITPPEMHKVELVCDFPDIFPEESHFMPPDRSVQFVIELIPLAVPTSGGLAACQRKS